MADERLCSIPGCGKKHLASGWCSAHYSRNRRHGDPLSSAVPTPKRFCAIEGCDRPYEARGYCNNHYKSFAKHGDPLKSEQWGTQKVCSIEGCSKPHYAHGFCAMHNWRRRERGSPTGGRSFNGEPLNFFKNVVLNCHQLDCLRWPFTMSNGYAVMAKHGQNRTMLVHRMACEARHGPAPGQGFQAAHLCGNAWCVNPDHSMWATATVNASHKKMHGTHLEGEKTPASKLCAEDVRKIRSLDGVLTRKEIASLFGTSDKNVSCIILRKSWKSIID